MESLKLEILNYQKKDGNVKVKVMNSNGTIYVNNRKLFQFFGYSILDAKTNSVIKQNSFRCAKPPRAGNKKFWVKIEKDLTVERIVYLSTKYRCKNGKEYIVKNDCDEIEMISEKAFLEKFEKNVEVTDLEVGKIGLKCTTLKFKL